MLRGLNGFLEKRSVHFCKGRGKFSEAAYACTSRVGMQSFNIHMKFEPSGLSVSPSLPLTHLHQASNVCLTWLVMLITGHKVRQVWFRFTLISLTLELLQISIRVIKRRIRLIFFELCGQHFLEIKVVASCPKELVEVVLRLYCTSCACCAGQKPFKYLADFPNCTALYIAALYKQQMIKNGISFPWEPPIFWHWFSSLIGRQNEKISKLFTEQKVPFWKISVGKHQNVGSPTMLFASAVTGWEHSAALER